MVYSIIDCLLWKGFSCGYPSKPGGFLMIAGPRQQILIGKRGWGVTDDRVSFCQQGKGIGACLAGQVWRGGG